MQLGNNSFVLFLVSFAKAAYQYFFCGVAKAEYKVLVKLHEGYAKDLICVLN